MPCLVLLLICSLTSRAFAEPPGGETEDLLHSDFSNPKELKDWRLPKGVWTVENGTLKGVELESEHHSAGAAHALDYHDATISFRFQFRGAKNGQLLIRNRFGNLCRVIFSPHQIRLQKDKPNVPKDTKEKTVTLAQKTIHLDENIWHHIVITVKGDTLSARINDMKTLIGKHPAIDVGKNEVEFFATGDAIYYDDLRVKARTRDPVVQ